MIETNKIIRVFLGSPGGLSDERQTAKRVVDEVNLINSVHWGCQIKLVGWEETIAGIGRAQALINKDLDQCQFFVGLMWNRWGTAPDTDGKFTSGFEEEFERAKSMVANGGMFDLTLLFKNISDDQLHDPGPEVSRVLAFKKQCIERKELLFKEFGDQNEFESAFRQAITAFAWKIVEEAKEQENQAVKEETSGVSEALTGAQTPENDEKTPLFSLQAKNFLLNIANRKGEYDDTSALDIARLRMISLTTDRYGNDDLFLGVHDANILFRNRMSMDISLPEVRVLSDAGILNFQSQVAPLWYWLKTEGKNNNFKALTRHSVFGSDASKAQSLNILRLTQSDIPSLDEYFDREKNITRWLNNEKTDSVVSSALKFLSECGQTADISVIESCLESMSEKHKNSAKSCIVELSMKSGQAEAISSLIRHAPTSISEKLTTKILKNPSSLSTETLKDLSEIIALAPKKQALRILSERDEIGTEKAEQLITDEDAEVRSIGLVQLIKTGRSFTDEEIKKIIVRQKKNKPNYFGNLTGRSAVTEGQEEYKSFQKANLKALTYPKLKAKALVSSPLDNLAREALYEKFYNREANSIRDFLNDRFKEYLEGRKNEIAGKDAKLLETFSKIESGLQEELLSISVMGLCRHSDSIDLTLVRTILNECEINYSAEIVKYLAKYGSWHDIQMITGFSETTASSFSLLDTHPQSMYDEIAKAALKVSKNRIGDLLDLELNYSLKNTIVSRLSKSAVRGLGNDFLKKSLLDKSDSYRKTVALKCNISLSQKQIQRLLSEYDSGPDARYYNVIHWLDLGSSWPRASAGLISRRALNDMGYAP